MLIIVAETIAHVDETYIVGIADGKEEMYSLLFDFYNYLKTSFENNNYERNWTLFDVSIRYLDEKDYNRIDIILEKYKDEIWNWRKHILDNEYVENFYNNILLLPIVVDDIGDDKTFIKTEDRDILNEIISHCNEVL